MDATALSEPADLIEIDRQIVGLTTVTPGIPAADVVRRLLGRWTGPYLRARIDLLGARGDIHISRENGRLYLYPPFKGDA